MSSQVVFPATLSTLSVTSQELFSAASLAGSSLLVFGVFVYRLVQKFPRRSTGRHYSLVHVLINTVAILVVGVTITGTVTEAVSHPIKLAAYTSTAVWVGPQHLSSLTRQTSLT